jgi:hypothetical protein
MGEGAATGKSSKPSTLIEKERERERDINIVFSKKR